MAAAPRVALLVTCLAEAFAPQVAEAAAELVARAGTPVDLIGHRCCGQPAWNAGYPEEARALAERLLPQLEGYERVVVPSGSCATMLLRYYPHLFPSGSAMARTAVAVAGRTQELSAFLAETLPGPGRGAARPEAAPGPAPTVAFHPSCHSLRGAQVGDAAQRCLAAAGCRLCRQRWSEECCGFGGLFAVKEPELSTAMADAKLDSLVAAGAETVVSGELGCLLHLEGRARRRGLPLRFHHLAEVLRERMPRA
jgi:L-lactate dehydrogenase complex protein LldE